MIFLISKEIKSAPDIAWKQFTTKIYLTEFPVKSYTISNEIITALSSENGSAVADVFFMSKCDKSLPVDFWYLKTGILKVMTNYLSNVIKSKMSLRERTTKLIF